NPYILKIKRSWDNEYLTLAISNSKEYLEIKGINLRALNLKYCENVKILDLRMKSLWIENCNRVSIQNIHITKKLAIATSHQIKIASSEIHKVMAFSGEQILFTNCDITKISRKSKGLMHIRSEPMERVVFNDSEQVSCQLKPNFWTCSRCGANSELDIDCVYCPECGYQLEKDYNILYNLED
ncbi:MAG: hypothetical protein ACFE8B_14565, partial [Candidatus Hermodarchaeota archaeon]